MHMPALSTEAGIALAIGDACTAEAASTEAAAGEENAREPIAVPYANVADLSGCEGTSSKVLIRNREAVVIVSARHATRGGRPGSEQGVVSGTAGDKAIFRSASSKVYAELKKIVTLSKPTAHNGASANMPAGLVVVPSQTKVLVAP